MTTDDLEGSIVMSEHQQPSVADHIADDLSNESTFWTNAHATFSGLVAATVSCSVRRSSRSS
ncbi:hypothetical protein [Ruania alba]|uniref:hypothetical protein n=1 Tax=Ruania alba TaxID=648782 RepID=UPI00158748AE|nr:hypothetical protein [Ruania alba]